MLKHREQSYAIEGKTAFCRKVWVLVFFPDYSKYLDGSTWQPPAEGAQWSMLRSTVPRGRAGRQQGQSEPSGTIPLTDTPFAHTRCPWRPFQSCKTSPWRSHWAAKDNLVLVLQGEAVDRQYKTLSPTAMGRLWGNLKDCREVNISSLADGPQTAFCFIKETHICSNTQSSLSPFLSCSQHCVTPPAVPRCLCTWMLTFPTPKL